MVIARAQASRLPSLICGLALVIICATWSLLDQGGNGDRVQPIPLERVEPWMLETIKGIGPKTAPTILKSMKMQGLSVLPAQAQRHLSDLVVDIPVPGNVHSNVQ